MFSGRTPIILCISAQPFVYEWKVEGDQLTFTVVEDDCEARLSAMTTRPHLRQQ